MLARLCSCDEEQVDRLFRQSALMRDKWDRQENGSTYGAQTLQKAVSDRRATIRDSAAWLYLTNDKPTKHWQNTQWFFEAIGIKLRLNELTKKVESSCAGLKLLSHDALITELRGRCAEAGYILPKNDMADHIKRISEEHSYHPVRDYLTSCLDEWDGLSRVRQLFEIFTLEGASADNPDLAYSLFEKWLITCVKLVFNEGNESAQGVLVLIGCQGIGKTRFINQIVPNQNWGKTGLMIDARNKDTIIQAVGYWIVELGEYGRNLSAEKSDHYKAFVTNTRDTFRAPYDRSYVDHPRSTVFYATTDTDAFLNDDAGERRNWTIHVSSIAETDVDIDQLWGEAAHYAINEKRPHWLSTEELKMLNKQNETFKRRSSEYMMLDEAFDWDAPKHSWLRLTCTEICGAKGVPLQSASKVGRALTSMYHKGMEKFHDTSKRLYTVPPFISEAAMAWICENTDEPVAKAAKLVKQSGVKQ